MEGSTSGFCSHKPAILILTGQLACQVCTRRKQRWWRATLKEIKGLVFVDSKDERRAILKREHQKGHFGADIVAENVIKYQKLYWPDMRKECEQICQSCALCQRFNVYQHRLNPLQSILADMPFDHVCIDLGQGPCTSSSGNNYFLLVVDACSRFVPLRPLRTKSIDEVGAELFYLFTCFGFPKILQSDNGTEFVNQIIKAIARSYKIEHRVITPCNTRANGTAEFTLKWPIAKRASDPARQDAERHDATKRIVRAHFEPGSLVMVVNNTRGSKTKSRYEGPYTVVRVNKGGAFVLKD